MLTIQEKYSFKKTPVHRVVRDFVIQTGDFTNGDGTGGNLKFCPSQTSFFSPRQKHLR